MLNRANIEEYENFHANLRLLMQMLHFLFSNHFHESIHLVMNLWNLFVENITKLLS